MTRYEPTRTDLKHTPQTYWDGLCLELWHVGLPNELRCQGPLGHDGPHKSRGFSWRQETAAPIDEARRFFAYYRSIPNSYHDIWLNDDSTIGMTLNAFQAATAFIGLNMNGD